MKIRRSTKCSFKFANKNKIKRLEYIIDEYRKVVNEFIDKFCVKMPESKADLLLPIVNSVDTWISARLRKVAAREAMDMVLSARRKSEVEKSDFVKPVHRGKRMCVSSTIASLRETEKTKEFDAWLHLFCMGNKEIMNIPIKLHKHYHKWNSIGKRLESYVITKDYVQLCFEIQTGAKKEKNKCVGIDTGINALASLSNGQQMGKDIKDSVERIKRCKHGSKGQKKAVRAMKQRMAEVSRDICGEATLVVVENLKDITKGTKVKRRLTKNIRRSIGRWNVAYWLRRLEMTCEEKNVSFRRVSPYNTSVTCSSCGYVDRRNRDREMFLCQRCSYADNADINAAKNILSRFLTGLYGVGCKPLEGHICL